MKKLLWLLLVVVMLVAGSGAFLLWGKQPSSFPIGSESAARLNPGPFEVHSHEELFIDTSRNTNPNGDFAGSAGRRLEATVWHPASSAQGPYPLVMYSHGFTSTRKGGTYLAEHLASHGYVVVAADYPLTSFSAPGGPAVEDVVNQPADISYMIDRVLEQNSTEGHMLAGMIDPKRIGATGISLGGMTTTLVTYHADMRDSRINAALSIAGPTAQFTPHFFTTTDAPFMMLAGNIDALVPYQTNAAPVVQKKAGAELVTVRNGSHTAFAGPAASLRWMNNPDSLGCAVVLRNIDSGQSVDWGEILGGAEQGVDADFPNDLCVMDPLPQALNVLRQQMIAQVVVTAFFQAQLGADERIRSAAQRYLQRTLAQEVPETDYERASAVSEPEVVGTSVGL
ncbi:MAG: CocE/NonD family hydrolase [Halioglobus sp.]